MSERIGDRIKGLRAVTNLTQGQLARFLDISPSTIGMYEQNRRMPDADILVKMAFHFGVSVDYLVGASDIGLPSLKTLFQDDSRDIGVDTKKDGSPMIGEPSLGEVLQEPLMRDIYEAVLGLSPETRKMVLAQIRAVQALEDDTKK